MSKDGWLTIPRVIAEEFLESEEKSLDGYTADVTLHPSREEKEKE